MTKISRDDLAMTMATTLPPFRIWAQAYTNQVSPNPRLTYRAIDILYHLRTRDPEGKVITSTDLAEFFAIRLSVVTVAIESLVAEGCIERRNDPADRRRYNFVVTEKGREISEEVERRFLEELRPHFENLDDHQAAELTRSLELIRRITADLNRDRHQARS